MKIESNMKKNYLKHYNIAKGIAVNKKTNYNNFNRYKLIFLF